MWRDDWARRGSIPACAGETIGERCRRRHQEVYPRVCGGNRRRNPGPSAEEGLSPRVRGKPGQPSDCLPSPRSIPACAGETTPAAFSTSKAGVYPRVCGGNARQLTPGKKKQGLSPRVRGKRRAELAAKDGGRSIPACAGETLRCWPPRGFGAVYPRVCGGNASWFSCVVPLPGLSPRVRGKLFRGLGNWLHEGSIPACAGETAPGRTWRRRVRVYPRVCGGNRCPPRPSPEAGGLSPRVRGKHLEFPELMQWVGSIPACAGETAAPLLRRRRP